MDPTNPKTPYYWCPTCRKFFHEIETVVVPSPVIHKVRNHVLQHDGDPKVVRHTVCSEQWTPPETFES